MQDRVFDAADVLVDRQPVIDGLAVGRRGRTGRTEAREVPGGIDERVECVCFTFRIGTAHVAAHMLPRRMTVERIARFVERHVIRQSYRQVFLANRDRTAGRTMDDRDRTAPVALA